VLNKVAPFLLQARPKVEQLRFATAKSSENVKIVVMVGYLQSQCAMTAEGAHAHETNRALIRGTQQHNTVARIPSQPQQHPVMSAQQYHAIHSTQTPYPTLPHTPPLPYTAASPSHLTFFLNPLPLSNVINERKAPQTLSSKNCAAEIPVGNSYGSSAARCDAD